MLAVAGLVLVVIGAAAWLDEGEVVVLHTSDADGGSSIETELWIVEYQGALYVRGARHRPWLERLRTHPEVELERNGESRSYRATPVTDPGVTAGVNAAMAARYGRADWIAGALVDRHPQIAVRLDPMLVSGGSPE